MEKHFKVGDSLYSVKLSGRSNPLQATVGEEEVKLSMNQVAEGEYVVEKSGKQSRLFIAPGKSGEVFVHFKGEVFTLISTENDFSDGSEGGTGTGNLMATMPGRVIKVLVEKGQEVEKNQPLLIMESMKMEITQVADFHGKVSEINIKAGDQVTSGSVLIVIEPIGGK